jgi:hypothetical protein
MTSFEPTEGYTTPAAAPTQDFREIAHSGGKIIFDISVDPDGRTQYRVTFTGSRPVPMSTFAIYALPQDIPVGNVHLGGIGQPWDPLLTHPAFRSSSPRTAKAILATSAPTVENIGVAERWCEFVCTAAVTVKHSNS